MRLFLHVLIKYTFSSESGGGGGAEVISEEFERTKREN